MPHFKVPLGLGTFKPQSLQHRKKTHRLRHRLFLPATAAGAPLIVALHGCKQTSNDFALGTRLDQHAARYGAAVLYPEQSKAANASGCWNWFLPEHQTRERGEPAAILRLVEEVSQRHAIDRNRIYVVGLSAGGAMAAILAEQAPDVFAGVGIMAGVALHRSHDLPSAFAAMGGRQNATAHANLPNLRNVQAPQYKRLPLMNALSRKGIPGLAVPQPMSLPNAFSTVLEPGSDAKADLPASAYARMRAMIWTGSNDTTVSPGNAMALAKQYAAMLGLDATSPKQRDAHGGAEVISWKDATGTVRVQLWTIAGMPHGWSGGSAEGSYTYPPGPDATAQMLGFFLEA